MHRNVTLKLEKSLLQKAKVVAAGRKSSLSALMSAALSNLVEDPGRYEKSKKTAIGQFRKFKLGGGPYYLSRSELYG